MAQVILDVLTPVRWEPWNQYNDHRACPSPRAAYLVDVDVVLGQRRWPVDPLRRATVGPDAPSLDGPVRLEFVRRPDRLSSGYGEFVHALIELEVGHIAAALVEHAERRGLRAIADPGGVWLHPSEPRTPGPTPPRSSGLGPRGLTADPRPLPRQALLALVQAARSRYPLAHPGLTHWLAVHNVTGGQDGWYTVDPFVLRRSGAAMETVQRHHGHPRSVIDVASMNLALITTADVPAAVRAGGSEAYPALLRAAGSLAQHVCTASAAVNMFCRPLRSFDDTALEAAIGVPSSHSLLYALLAGRSRVSGFSYDLTPLEP
ncbi:hypothetical protein [Actinocrispum sp. NPDC049592]|uniref:hypothetical protein n=1 Tax=Actinocrispum sp. NPDC049592 TaxID=3154835 RepID=UPI00341AC6EB